ncbi:hypothetical protein [Arthrobacter oryzae]|uniref:Uncharacterized protein n=1 Tax=Arthrobacter oryzae TaxID=409290 RepID=A0A3N0C3Q0_9MICC|nr:hypothetical protein [Arthrobacter oryzae]RNL57264.1 hypothetical protein D7003_07365 [Arthrobacter oryzae]
MPLPWTADPALNLGSALTETAAEPWLPIPEDWGTHAIERQQEDPESPLALATAAQALRRKRWDDRIFTADECGSWSVETGDLLICERSADFFVAVAMGSEPARLPAGTMLLSALPLEAEGWLQANNAAWVLRAEAAGIF